jgi:hypothetical protein
MRWLMRFAEFFSNARDTGESLDVVRSALVQRAESSRAIEASYRNRQANGRLREAVREIKNSAFSGLEAAHRDR